MSEILEKTCTGPCGRTLPVASFGNAKGGKYGVRAECKFCQNIRHRNHHRAFPEVRNSRRRELRRGPHGEVLRARHRAATPEQKAKRGMTTKRWREKLKAACFTAYGGYCQCCGETDYRLLTLDHVNSDGRQHRRQIKAEHSWTVIYQWAQQNGYPPTLRLLCWTCNNGAYRNLANQGVCPHQELSIVAMAMGQQTLEIAA